MNLKTKPLDALPEVPIVLRKVTNSQYSQSNKRTFRYNKSAGEDSRFWNKKLYKNVLEGSLATIATDDLNNSYSDLHMANSDSTIVNANLCLESASEKKCSTCGLDR